MMSTMTSNRSLAHAANQQGGEGSMASMLTTVDNPYDPRTNWTEWYQWDVAQGYNTSAYLARVAMIADEFPEIVQDRQVEEAIDEIVALHDGELYKKLPL